MRLEASSIPLPSRPTLASLAIACFAAVYAAQSVRHFELPLQAALGRSLLLDGLTSVDPLLLMPTPSGYRSVASELLLYAAHRWLGPLGLSVVAAVMGWLVVGGAHCRAKRQSGIAPLAALLAVLAIYPYVAATPAALSLVLWGWLLSILWGHRYAESTSHRNRLIALAPPVCLLWANTHPGAGLGASLVVLYAACRWLDRGPIGARLPLQDRAWLTVGAAMSMLAVAANPIGFRLLAHATDGGADLSTKGATALSFYLTGIPGITMSIVLAVAALAFGRDAQTTRRAPEPFDVAAVGACLGACALSPRLAPYAGLLAISVATARFAEAFDKRVWGPRLACIALWAAPIVSSSTVSKFGVGWDPGYFPVEAVAFASANGLRGPVYNFGPFGGYLALERGPSQKLLRDTRKTTQRSEALAARIREADQSAERLDALTRELGLEWALVNAAEGASTGRSIAEARDWTMVHLDDRAAVYVRSSGVNRSLARDGYNLLRHTMGRGAVLAAAAQGNLDPAALTRDSERARAQSPKGQRAAFLVATAALARRDGQDFDASLVRLQSVSAGDPMVDRLIGVWQKVGD